MLSKSQRNSLDSQTCMHKNDPKNDSSVLSIAPTKSWKILVTTQTFEFVFWLKILYKSQSSDQNPCDIPLNPGWFIWILTMAYYNAYLAG